MKTKIWSDDSGVELDAEIEAYTVGNDKEIDKKLIKYDIQASIAHSDVLLEMKVLSPAEHSKINHALNKLSSKIESVKFTLEGNEDCHSYIEAYLSEVVGIAGKKIHTARSRNDQSLTMVRLYMKESMNDCLKLVKKLQKTINVQAKKQQKTDMPGYTHMQKAMPTTVGIWLGSFADALQDSMLILQSTTEVIDQNPLGSGAGFGSSLNFDREITTTKLGFAKVQENPMYCGLSRGYFEIMCLQSLNLSMSVVGKLVSDLLLFTTQEFCFFSLPPNYTTGSSIMPHKHNYDVLEIARGKCHIFWTHQQKIQSIFGSIGSGYQRDLQLTKEIFVDAIIDFKQTFSVISKVVESLEIHSECLKLAIAPEMHSVTKINDLVKNGETFRDAYKKVKKQISA
ncbi:MAG: argininosuccinate lyase [Candidatus Saccharibacteria bacterium]|nr:argininosuccinate lyase [Candidatus Saccharibacteria bacterium]